jgi:predicted transcriptional regulator
MSTKTIKVGILSWDKYQERTLAIARGEFKPKPGDPKIYFPSLKSAGEILSEKNLELLRVIATRKPASISELAPMVHRAQPNLTRTLRKMEQYGLIDMVPEGKAIRPVAKAKKVHFEADFNLAAA